MIPGIQLVSKPGTSVVTPAAASSSSSLSITPAVATQFTESKRSVSKFLEPETEVATPEPKRHATGSTDRPKNKGTKMSDDYVPRAVIEKFLGDAPPREVPMITCPACSIKTLKGSKFCDCCDYVFPAAMPVWSNEDSILKGNLRTRRVGDDPM